MEDTIKIQRALLARFIDNVRGVADGNVEGYNDVELLRCEGRQSYAEDVLAELNNIVDLDEFSKEPLVRDSKDSDGLY